MPRRKRQPTWQPVWYVGTRDFHTVDVKQGRERIRVVTRHREPHYLRDDVIKHLAELEPGDWALEEPDTLTYGTTPTVGTVQYIGAQNPHTEEVDVGGYQNFLISVVPGQILSLPEAVCAYLVAVKGNWWAPVDGWTPPPSGPATGYVAWVYANYPVVFGNGYVFGDPTVGGSFTVTLPEATTVTGMLLTVKHVGTANTITIDPTGTDTIDGATSYSLTAGVFVQMYADGTTRWKITAYPSGGGVLPPSVVTDSSVGPSPIVAASGSRARSLRDVVSIKDFGAACNGVTRADAQISGGALSALSCTGYSFVTGDVGKTVILIAAGASTYQAYVGTIASETGGVATLSVPASGASANGTVIFGTDDGTAWTNALAYMVANVRCRLRVPASISIVGSTLSETLTADMFWQIDGDGVGASTIISTAAGGFLNINATGTPSSGRASQFTFAGLTIQTPLAGATTGITITAAEGGSQHQRSFEMDHVQVCGVSPLYGWWVQPIQGLGQWRPKLDDVIVSGLFDPSVSGNYADNSPMYYPTCGIVLDNSYAPSIGKIDVWSCSRGLQCVTPVGSSPTGAPEGAFLHEPTIVNCREGIFWETPGEQPQLSMSGGHINCRDWNVCLYSKKYMQISDFLFYQTGFVGGPLTISNGGSPLSTTATSIPVAAIDAQTWPSIMTLASGEKINVTGYSSPNLTGVTRGLFGTTPVSVADGSGVYGATVGALATAITTSAEVDTLTITGSPTGGTFTVSFTWNSVSYTTAAIPYNATAPIVAAAIQAATGSTALPANCVSVAGGQLPGTAMTVTWQNGVTGAVSSQSAASSLTGGSSPAVTFVQTTAGSTPPTTITLVSTAGMPSIGVVLIGSEWWAYNNLVTGMDGTHLNNVVRGNLGTVDPGNTYATGTVVSAAPCDVISVGSLCLKVTDNIFEFNANNKRINVLSMQSVDVIVSDNYHAAQGYATGVDYQSTGFRQEGNRMGATGAATTATPTRILDGGPDTRVVADKWRGVRVYQTSPRAISTSGTAGSVAPSPTGITWDALWPGTTDTEGIWNGPGSNAFTIPANDGIKAVRVTAQVAWQENSTGDRLLEISQDSVYTEIGIALTNRTALTDDQTFLEISTGPIPVQPGDIIRLAAGQSSGVNLNLGGSQYTWMCVEVVEGA